MPPPNSSEPISEPATKPPSMPPQRPIPDAAPGICGLVWPGLICGEVGLVDGAGALR
jgi:hypothetical protein